MRVGGRRSKTVAQECREFGFAHLAAAHGEVAMVDAAEAADMAVDLHVVGRVGEHELAPWRLQQGIVGRLVARIAAQQAVMSEQPQVAQVG